MGQQYFIVRVGLHYIRSAWTASDALCRDKPVEGLLEFRRRGRRKCRQSAWREEPDVAEDRLRTDMLPDMSTHCVDTQKAGASMCSVVCWESRMFSLLDRFVGSTFWPSGGWRATVSRWAPSWPYEPCYMGWLVPQLACTDDYKVDAPKTVNLSKTVSTILVPYLEFT